MSTQPDSQVEIYPMASFPTLTISDIEASLHWYTEGLGFVNVFTMPGPDGIPTLVHRRWVKYADLLLFPDEDHSLDQAARGPGIALNYSAADVDELAERARAHDVNIVEGPVNRPWNSRELVVLDPDGYRLVFNGPIPEGPLRSFEEIVQEASRRSRDL